MVTLIIGKKVSKRVQSLLTMYHTRQDLLIQSIMKLQAMTHFLDF